MIAGKALFIYLFCRNQFSYPIHKTIN
jgi:hypothetical protein